MIVVDDGHKHGASSPAAAGIINPLAGKRFALYPDTDAILNSALQSYAALEHQLGCRLYHPLPLIRYCQDSGEAERLARRLDDPDYAPWIAEHLVPSTRHPFGGLVTARSGWLDAPGLLDALRHWLRDRACLIETAIDHQDFTIHPASIRWQEYEATRVIFCEGWRVRNNPWFQKLPWDPVQGDILSLNLPGHARTHILNSGKWISPHTGKRFRAGATYRRDNLDDPQPSSSGMREILDAIRDLLPEITPDPVGHLSGVRPGTRTQHPLIGQHPEHPGLVLFNGFGSKGAFLIPYHARLLKNALLQDFPLPKRVDIRERWTP